MTASANGLRARRKQGLKLRTLDGEVLVYDPETTRASCLNRFAAEVLERCDGEHAPAEIAEDLPFENVDPRLVMLTLADLQKAQLLEPDAVIDVASHIGQSRRDFFKRIGLGTAVAVPVVTAIVLPTPAQALSAGDKCRITGSDPCPPPLMCKPRGGGGGVLDPQNPCENQGDDCVCK